MFNPYSAGNKVYGMGRNNPTSGPVDPIGYKERDRLAAARRNAVLRRLQAMQGGRYMSAAYLGTPTNGAA